MFVLSQILIWRRYIESIMVIFPVFKQFPTWIFHSWVCKDSDCPLLYFKNLITIRLISPKSYPIAHNRMYVRKVHHSQGFWRHYSLDLSNCKTAVFNLDIIWSIWAFHDRQSSIINPTKFRIWCSFDVVTRVVNFKIIIPATFVCKLLVMCFIVI
jgi:hypothetical protein